MKIRNKTTKSIGDFGEEKAAEFLRKNGFRILEKQYRYKRCEIDLIALDKDYLVFAEVKTRTSTGPDASAFGRPARAVTAQKQRLLLCAAYDYLRNHPQEKQPRMDVIEVYVSADNDSNLHVNKIMHIRNAFGRT